MQLLVWDNSNLLSVGRQLMHFSYLFSIARILSVRILL